MLKIVKVTGTQTFMNFMFIAIIVFVFVPVTRSLMFKSTVHQNGTNLVLFEPSDVQVIKESAEHINTSEYIF